ncbi:hypothetical protein NDU88_011438 [Pleurodeles waltl]|uniref:Uncharacterized protein n=1 Tax=Pleurodeles waltl TaxID=8319 RepID=A0AAV7QX87_PLEWA|nr:hypothetical protein NDU88_011438 [Pleurodeles waltl]
MLFPAKLKIITNNDTLFFTSPQQAQEWLDTLGTTGQGSRGRTAHPLKESCSKKEQPLDGSALLCDQALQEREDTVRAAEALRREGSTLTRSSDLQSDRESFSDGASYSSLDAMENLLRVTPGTSDKII